MLFSRRFQAISVALVSSWFVVSLAGCGGGGGEGSFGEPQLPEHLSLGSTVFFGTSQGGSNALSPFSALPSTGVPVPTGGSYTVPSSEFSVGSSGRQDFLQLSFNTLVQASSIVTAPPSGGDGIVVYRTVEQPSGSGNFVSTAQPFTLDSAGVIDPSNTFPTPGTAPATLRLYYNADGDLSTAESLPIGLYTLAITQNLRSIGGGPFCSTGGGANCINTYLPSIPFSIGNDAMPLAMNSSTPSSPTVNDPNVPLNAEITLNFSKAIDFESLVGPGNTTTLDPFVSRPRSIAPVANCNTGGPLIPPFQGIGNLFVNYVAPLDPVTLTPELPPANIGFIVYMPDPFLNPTQVRIRFCDIANLQGLNVPGAQVYQNYASNSEKLPITSSNPAQTGTRLQLPPILAVPGSLSGYTPSGNYRTDVNSAFVDIVVMSATPTQSTPPFPATPMGGTVCVQPDPTQPGVRDRATVSNGLVADFWLSFAFSAGPSLARNPQAPDATIVARTTSSVRGLACLNTATTTVNPGGPTSSFPVVFGGQVTGQFSLRPNPLQNTGILGTPKDVEIGHWIRSQTVPGQGTNNITNPGRCNAGTPGVPDSQNGSFPNGMTCFCNPLAPCPPVQPLGNFIYVADGDSQSLKVFNSYNFNLITTIAGVASPEGLGIEPNLEFLYVSNFNQGTIQKIFANPASPNFNTISNTIPVGSGPSSISVQPGNEDVFVCNFSDNSFSILDRATGQVRVTLADPSGQGPSDAFITNRMTGINLTNAYTAFITNFFSDNVTIYESDSPAVPENSLQGVVKANVGGFAGPKRGCWNWQTYVTGLSEPGCYVANSQGTRIDQLTMQNFTLSPPPNFPGPPGQRTFHILSSMDASQLPTIGGASPTDVSMECMSGMYNWVQNGVSNNKGLCDPSVGGGVPSVVLASYAGAGVVVSFAYNSGSTVLASVSVPGCDFLHSYYDQ